MAALVAGILAYPGTDAAVPESMTPVEESPISRATSMVFGEAASSSKLANNNGSSWDGDRENIYLNGKPLMLCADSESIVS